MLTKTLLKCSGRRFEIRRKLPLTARETIMKPKKSKMIYVQKVEIVRKSRGEKRSVSSSLVYETKMKKLMRRVR